MGVTPQMPGDIWACQDPQLGWCVSGLEEPLWGHRGRVTAQPRLRVQGTQAKPRGGALLWNSTSRPRLPALSGHTGEQGHRAGASTAALV